jgi:hypothetical protein
MQEIRPAQPKKDAKHEFVKVRNLQVFPVNYGENYPELVNKADKCGKDWGVRPEGTMQPSTHCAVDRPVAVQDVTDDGEFVYHPALGRSGANLV